MNERDHLERAMSTTWGYLFIALGTLLFVVTFAASGIASMLGLPDISSGTWIGLGLVVVGFIILTGDDEPSEE